MKRTEKEQLVTELKEKIEGAKALYYTDFTGLNVKRMTELRRRLRKANVEYVVIKNTLALRAVNESGLVGERLRGPTGLVVGKDPVGAAKVLTDFAKENDQRPAVKGGMLDGHVDRRGAGEASWRRCRRASRCSPSSAPGCSPRSAAFVGALNGLLMTCLQARSKRCGRSAKARRDNSQALRLIATNAPGYAWESLQERHDNG